MQLTHHTDLAFRLLIHLAQRDGERCLIADVAKVQEVSRTHLMKVASKLAHAGLLDSTRGNGGGIRLAKAPHEINLGAVVEAMEPACPMVDCTGCKLISRCRLAGMLERGRRAFLAEVGGYTLADAAG